MLEVSPSRRPVGTSNDGPPVMATASRAASAMMSAQETTPGHWSSSCALAASTTFWPRRPWFLPLSTSASLLALLMSTDASHPLTKQSWNWRRSSAGRMVGSLPAASWTAAVTVSSASGQ
uniref:Uncharacterized protein n=1 Tax=Zea mays TaxID=4577 RepID=C4J403_MAIZE|nr:unknown [Zea mays]